MYPTGTFGESLAKDTARHQATSYLRPLAFAKPSKGLIARDGAVCRISLLSSLSLFSLSLHIYIYICIHTHAYKYKHIYIYTHTHV